MEKNFFDQPIKNIIKAFENIRKINRHLMLILKQFNRLILLEI